MDAYSRERVAGFLRTDGRLMRNGRGQEVLLRGWGAGNWTNPEGFLAGDSPRPWSSGDAARRPGPWERARTMEDSLRLLCGREYAEGFWQRWYRNHLGEGDLRAMAELGYNSVRLPLNARAFLPEEPGYAWKEDSFRMLDQVLDWCEAYRLYAILDLHTAPGGQSGIKCDDGIDSVPRLFFEPESRERTIRLWEELARRYKDRWIVGGYDLLNEPLAPSRYLYLLPELEDFYDRLIHRIRAIDRNHMLTIEGGSAATNTEIFHRDYDPECHNWCIHIHYYGLSPERRSLFRYLEPSLRLNVPIWMGEGGGDAQELSALLAAAEAEHIGFNLWCWKVASLPDGSRRRDPVQYALPKGWRHILACLHEGAPRPDYAACQAVFNEMLDAMQYENCHLSPEQHTILLRRPGRTVPAAAYDFQPGSFRGTWQEGNPFDYRTEDSMRLVLREGCLPPRRAMPFDNSPPPRSQPLDCLNLVLGEGEYASYTLRDAAAPCQVWLRLRSLRPAALLLSCQDMQVSLSVPAGEEFQELHALTLPAAPAQQLQLRAIQGEVEMESLRFSRST